MIRAPRVLVVIASGSFNAGALLTAGRLAAKGKYQEQKYSDATIYIFSINDQVNIPGVMNMRVKEPAVTTLGTNNLVIGELAAVLGRHRGDTEVTLRLHRGASAKVFEVPMPVQVTADLYGELKGLLGPNCLG